MYRRGCPRMAQVLHAWGETASCGQLGAHSRRPTGIAPLWGSVHDTSGWHQSPPRRNSVGILRALHQVCERGQLSPRRSSGRLGRPQLAPQLLVFSLQSRHLGLQLRGVRQPPLPAAGGGQAVLDRPLQLLGLRFTALRAAVSLDLPLLRVREHHADARQGARGVRRHSLRKQERQDKARRTDLFSSAASASRAGSFAAAPPCVCCLPTSCVLCGGNAARVSGCGWERSDSSASTHLLFRRAVGAVVRCGCMPRLSQHGTRSRDDSSSRQRARCA